MRDLVKITVTVCIFKRKRNSKLELGIMIGNGELLIDRNFKPVEIGDVWDYTMLPYEGLLPIKLIEDKMRLDWLEKQDGYYCFDIKAMSDKLLHPVTRQAISTAMKGGG